MKKAIAALLLLSCAAALMAQETQSEDEKVIQSIKWQEGPGNANLADIAGIKVPEGFAFAGPADANKLMELFGNAPMEDLLGLLAPRKLDWFVLYEFDGIGYVRDDEKDSLDADALLKSIQKSTMESNKFRKKRGLPALINVSWVTKPSYDQMTHNLEWATLGEDEDGEKSVNHNTRLLGRRGTMVVTLVAEPENIAEVLPAFRSSLADFAFKPGNSYAEFRSGDKLAGYGLTALVAGGATAVAVKTGLFKYIWKFLVFIFIGLSAFFKKIWAKIMGFFRSEDRQPPH